MTAASNSESRKRNVAPADPVEIVARACGDPGAFLARRVDMGWSEDEKQYESLTRWQARAIVAALRENGFTL